MKKKRPQKFLTHKYQAMRQGERANSATPTVRMRSKNRGRGPATLLGDRGVKLSSTEADIPLPSRPVRSTVPQAAVGSDAVDSIIPTTALVTSGRAISSIAARIGAPRGEVSCAGAARPVQCRGALAVWRMVGQYHVIAVGCSWGCLTVVSAFSGPRLSCLRGSLSVSWMRVDRTDAVLAALLHRLHLPAHVTAALRLASALSIDASMDHVLGRIKPPCPRNGSPSA